MSIKVTIGHVEAGGQAHQAERLAVAFRKGTAEVAGQVRFGIAPLLGTDDHDGFIPDPAQAADNGLIILEQAVAVQFLRNR